MSDARFVVVGAGVFGAWIAYTLRKSGHAVTLLDQYGPANPRSSSAGETRIIRAAYGADEIYTRMAQRSLDLWLDFFAAVEKPHLFQPTGALWITAPGDAYASASRVALRNAGIPFEDLTPDELSRRYPQMWPPPNAGAIFEKNAGALLARQAVQSVVDEFVRIGGEFRLASIKEPICQKARIESLATTSGESISADVFVFACGPWLRNLFWNLLGKRIFATRQPVAYFGVAALDQRFSPPHLPVWLEFSGGRDMYGFPAFDSYGVKVACHALGKEIEPDSVDRTVDETTLRQLGAYLLTRFPTFGAAPVLLTQVCQYEQSSNGDFFLDRHPEVENFFIAGGGSGHGFKHGPAVGEYMMKLILDPSAPREERFSILSKNKVLNRLVL